MRSDGLRHSGIDVIGNVPWSTHYCQFYRTNDDLIDILVPYFISEPRIAIQKRTKNINATTGGYMR